MYKRLNVHEWMLQEVGATVDSKSGSYPHITNVTFFYFTLWYVYRIEVRFRIFFLKKIYIQENIHHYNTEPTKYTPAMTLFHTYLLQVWTGIAQSV